MMMKILIVDDEMLVRAGIKSSVNWAELGYRIIGEAENGQAALDIIAEKRPDIVLLDIKMPVTDGLEVLKNLRNAGELCKVVILSCHNEFDYVREALKNGAFDYLLKHEINTDKIIEVLNNAREAVLKEDNDKVSLERLQKQVEQGKEYRKRECLIRLIRGAASNEHELRDESFGFKIRNHNLFCILFEVDHLDEVKKRYDPDNVYLLESSILNIGKEVIVNEEEMEFFQYNTNQYVILISYSRVNSRQQQYHGIRSMIQSLHDALENYLNIKVSFGISNCYHGYQNSKEAFRQGETAISQNFWNHNQYIFFYRDVNINKTVELLQLLPEIKQKIKRFLDDNDFEAVDLMIQENLNRFDEARFYDIKAVKNFFSGLSDIISHRLSPEQVRGDEIKECADFQEIGMIFSKLIGTLKSSDQTVLQTNKYLIKQTMKYIQENYNKELTLDIIATYLGVSQSYISRFFKKETGVSMTRYINITRIEKAKQLLRESNLKNYEIAEKAGFKSPVHFDMVFRNLTGTTPTIYRNS